MVSDEDAVSIVGMYRAGIAATVIAKRFGLDVKAVRRLLQQKGARATSYHSNRKGAKSSRLGAFDNGLDRIE